MERILHKAAPNGKQRQPRTVACCDDLGRLAGVEMLASFVAMLA